jgi:hypothetical protein
MLILVSSSLRCQFNVTLLHVHRPAGSTLLSRSRQTSSQWCGTDNPGRDPACVSNFTTPSWPAPSWICSRSPSTEPVMPRWVGYRIQLLSGWRSRCKASARLFCISFWPVRTISLAPPCCLCSLKSIACQVPRFSAPSRSGC